MNNRIERKSRTTEEKLSAALEFVVRKSSVSHLEEKYSVHRGQLKRWKDYFTKIGILNDELISRWQVAGPSVFEGMDLHRSSWDDDTKIEAVKRYLTGRGTGSQVALEFGIDRTMLFVWERRLREKGLITDSLLSQWIAEIGIPNGNEKIRDQQKLINTKRKWRKKYSKATLIEILREYFQGTSSTQALFKKFDISAYHLKSSLNRLRKSNDINEDIINKWIANALACSSITVTQRARISVRRKPRWSLEEKLPVALDYIRNEETIKVIADKYQISRQVVHAFFKTCFSAGLIPEDLIHDIRSTRDSNRLGRINRWSDDIKLENIEKIYKKSEPLRKVCKRLGINPSYIEKWKSELMSKGKLTQDQIDNWVSFCISP